MHLFSTGAFVRATRTARLAGIANRSLLIPLAQSSRSINSTASRSEQSPTNTQTSAQSSDQGSRPLVITLPNTTTPTSRFKDHLANEAEENTIVTNATGLSGTKILNQTFVFDETSNLSPSILDCIGRNLYNIPNHPICITRRLVESVFAYPTYKNHVATNPVVTTKDNFDVLGFPEDHPGRSRTDTYYIDATHVLRTHTSAHQHSAFQYMSKNPEQGYTICADVYRRDSIDRSHYPVFHQMEGAHLWQLPVAREAYETRYSRLEKRVNQIKYDFRLLPTHDLEIIDDAGAFNHDTNPVQVNHDQNECVAIGRHLKRSLELLVAKVFSSAREAGIGHQTSDEPLKIRWIEAYFPFTSPSWELEVWWQGQWLELLGCGVIQQSILNNAGLKDRVGWAWGIGIERLAMLLFGVPDIRLFWSKDERFLNQFKEGIISRYEPFSKFPTCYKDVAFWLPSTSPTASPITASPSSSSQPSTGPGVAQAAGGNSTLSPPTSNVPSAFHENDFMEIVRDVAGSLAEDVTLVDEFVHPRNGKKSLCYRINYRSLERTLTNEETNALHERVREELVQRFPGLKLR